MSNDDDVPTLISLNAACERTSLSRTMINLLRSEQRFPEAVTLGDRRVGFVKAEVDAWIRARILARDGKKAAAARAEVA